MGFIIKRLFYFFVWSLAYISSHVFYAKMVIRNKKRFHVKTATIAVANHPNTLFDPLIVAMNLNWFVHILANAGIFKNPVIDFILGRSYGVKVERPQDVNGKKVQNDEAFRFAADFLTGGGCLLIMPEGGSDIPRRLRRVKTGTARIALSSENKNDFKLGLEILPVGLTYTSQTEFRTQLFINVGEPIKVVDFKKNYEKDNFQAALDLTAEMEQRMKDLIIHTEDDEEDAFLRKLETIAQTENPLSLEPAYDRSQQLLSGWRNFQKEKNTEATNFKNKMHTYFDFLGKNKIRDKVLVKTQQSNFKSNWFFRFVFVLLGFPFFIYGWVNNLLANYIPAWVTKKVKLHVAYTSTIKAATGLFTYLIFYGLQIKLVRHFTNESWIVWVYIVSVILTGLFAWWFKDFAKDTLSGWRFFRFLQKEKNTKKETLESRKYIVNEMNTFLQDVQ